MAKKVAPLTFSQIKNAKAKEKEYTLSDGNGLLLRVRPNSSKTWLFNYLTPISKKRVKISFGSFPDVSLSEARDKRADARELLRNNIDPNTHRKKADQSAKDKIEDTFSVFADEYIKLKRQTTKASTHIKNEERIKNHLLPILGDIPISEIKPRDIRIILDPLSLDGKLETVKRLCNISNEIMRIALFNGKIEFNPIEKISLLYPAKKVKHNPSLKPSELPVLLKTVDEANISEITRNLILWQLHTMTRPAESAKAKWSEMDFIKQVWTIPGDRMKMKRDHEIPLTKQMLTILNEMKVYKKSEYIFPAARKRNAHACVESANTALKRMGFKDRTTAHGLRSLASTTLNEQDFDSDVIETCLAHVDKNTIRRIYNRTTYLEKRKEVMNWWSCHIESSGFHVGLHTGLHKR